MNLHMLTADLRYDVFWENFIDNYDYEINRLHIVPSVIRLCSRGEAITSEDDIEMLISLATSHMNTIFWIPTRSWRCDELLDSLVELKDLSNIRLLASLDPSNTEEEFIMLKENGFSTMYFGDNTNTKDKFLCPKTHFKIHGNCGNCTDGCLSVSRVDIHLKQH